jgi:malate dehydrogenase (oxaloacetate-decarboxylating)
VAVEEGVAPKATEAELRASIQTAQWVPDYDD